MKIRLFGKDLFEFNGRGADYYAVPSMSNVEKATHLPDFKKMGHGGEWSGSEQSLSNWVVTTDTSTASATMGSGAIVIREESLKKAATPKEKAKLTPKKVHEMRFLNDMAFRLNTDPKYVDGQIADFKAKLALMRDPRYDHMGSSEIGSILLRMENRKKYASVKAVIEKYPYTTNKRIESVVKNHSNLQLGEVSQFIADMPKEATEAMKEYTAACEKLCDKKAIFYIIADKKDFAKTNSRRDPILLAQSPFGHFWQILGAWDEEMLFLDEL